MSVFVESYAWCIGQVTLLSAAAACLYLFSRLVRASGRGMLLVATLVAAIALTFVSASPWPRWDWGGRELMADALQTNTSFEAESKRSEIADAEELALPVRPAAEAASPLAEFSEMVPMTRAALPWWHILVLGAWAASAIGMIRLAIGIVHLRRCRRQSSAIDDQELLQLFHALQGQYTLRRPVELRESPRLGVAATVGWRRPLVLLPPSWREWTADQRRAVLAHELAHVGERHFPAWIAGQLAVVAHFYHPLIHWLARRLRLEQELAADTLAASAFADRRQYAAVLASLALGPPRPPHLIAPLGLFMSRPLLMRRIAMLRQTNEPSRKPLRRNRLFMFLLVGLLGVGVAGLRAKAQVDNPLSDNVPGPVDANQTIRVVSLLRVSRGGGLMAEKNEAMSDTAWKAYCSSHVALIKSDWLLSAALAEDQIRDLPIIKSQPHPVAWLQKNLRVGLISDSEILYVLMYCTPKEMDQVKQVVDAVVKAHKSGIIYRDKQQTLVTIDALRRSLQSLNNEIRRDTQTYLDLARELGSSAADGQMAQQLALKRLDRVDAELMRLEGEFIELHFNFKTKIESLEEQIKNKSDEVTTDKARDDAIREFKTKTELFQQRTSTLKRTQDELTITLHKASQKSVELTNLAAKLEQKQQIANELTMKLQRLQLEAEAPPQIQPMYGSAIATDAGSPPPTPPKPNTPR